jgi:hypothetical protein
MLNSETINNLDEITDFSFNSKEAIEIIINIIS